MESVGLDLSRVEARFGNFVLQLIGYEQKIARLEAENAELIAQLAATKEPPKVAVMELARTRDD